MPKFPKNTSAFMMKGYTYPGTSPFTKSSPAKNEGENHPMMGTVNDKGTRVVNEKGDWVGVGDRPDLVKTKETTTKDSPAQNYKKGYYKK